MTKEEAVKKIAELVALAEDSIQEAEQIADEHNLSFEFSPAYGMGGVYNGGDGSDSSWLVQGVCVGTLRRHPSDVQRRVY